VRGNDAKSLTDVATGDKKSAPIECAARATLSPTEEPGKESMSIPASQLEGPVPWVVRLPLMPEARGL
jgi:hypothetical protein